MIETYPVYIYLKNGEKFSMMIIDSNSSKSQKNAKFQIVKRIQQFLELV